MRLCGIRISITRIAEAMSSSTDGVRRNSDSASLGQGRMRSRSHCALVSTEGGIVFQTLDRTARGPRALHKKRYHGVVL